MSDTEEAKKPEGVKIPAWIVVLIVTNIAAVAGPAATFFSWKGSIETEHRLSREAAARDLASLRAETQAGFLQVTRRLEANDGFASQIAALQVSVQNAQSRGEDIAARLRDLESQTRRAPR